MKNKLLNKAEINYLMQDIKGWILFKDNLKKKFIFDNFQEAFSFMTYVALNAEILNHHPIWSNVYATVDIELKTHDMNGLTLLDFELAKAIDKYHKKTYHLTE